MNVLILSDFSEVAINATHYAMDLLYEKPVTFILANIFVPNPQASMQELEEKRRVTQFRLQERVEKLQERSAGRPHKVKGHYSEQNLVNATRAFLNQNNIELLVMGAVGKNRRKSTILGDHTYEIISKIKCNILAVPDDVQYTAVQNILMPIDYSVSFSSKNLQFLNYKNFSHKTSLNVLEIGNMVEAEQMDFKQEIIKSSSNMRVSFSSLDDSNTYDIKHWNEVQKKFELIVLLGKNVNLCNRLMHDKDGLYSTVPNRLPILVLHD